MYTMAGSEADDTTTPHPPADGDRDVLLRAPRPRRLPITESAPSPGRKRLPLAPEARAVDREERPIYAVWELTLACDLSCRHCGSRAGRARPDELTTAEACDLVRQMADLGVREVALIGGEAYLHDGWLDVVREIRRAGMECTMVTGGRGMTAERAREAAEAGVQSVAVSIDGAAQTHDRLRGMQGSYAAAVQALDNCRAAGMQIALNTQINRLSLPDLDEVLDIAIRVGAHGWQVQLTVPVGRAADEPDVILQPYDLLELFPLLARLKARCDAARIKLLPGNNVGYFGPFEAQLRGMGTLHHGRTCPAGKLALGIEANGDIKGCPSLPTESWVGGNVREQRLVDIWERSLPLRYTRDATEDSLWGYCRECYYASECMGGCTWMTTALFDRPGNDPYCHHRALEMARMGKRERVARTGPAPGLPFDRASWAIFVEDDPRGTSNEQAG
jgi:radical SAM protein with 4Fe4S-binding SPASM domain